MALLDSVKARAGAPPGMTGGGSVYRRPSDGSPVLKSAAGYAHFEIGAPARSNTVRVSRVGATTVDLITRAATPIGLDVAVVSGKSRKLASQPTLDRKDPKRSITTTVPNSKISGDPIRQLNATRNAAVNPRMNRVVPRTPAKIGDYQGFGNRVPIKRESEDTRARRREALRGEYGKEALRRGGHVTLGVNGSGLDFYRNARLKPGLKGGSMDYVAPVDTTPLSGRSGSLQRITQPRGTSYSLADEGAMSDALGSRNTLPIGTRDDVTVMHMELARVSENPANRPESAGDSAGRLVFLVGAVFVAWLVLHKGGA